MESTPLYGVNCGNMVFEITITATPEPDGGYDSLFTFAHTDGETEATLTIDSDVRAHDRMEDGHY
jgi:hypothetical protein